MCVMARCITYFTMLVELLIIKNVKFVGVMLSTGYRSLIHPPFYMSSGRAAHSIEEATLVLFLIKSDD